MDNYVPAKDLAAQAASSENQATEGTIAAIREQIRVKFESEELGHLLTKYHVDRDKQMQTLTGLGKDVLLSLMSQGILPATLAESLEIAYDTFHEYIRLTCSKDEIKHMESLQADNLIAKGLKELDEAQDKDDIPRAKAIAEMNLKIAKALSGRYTEQKPTTAVQINNNTYKESDGPEVSFVKFPQMEVPDVTTLPALEDHAYKSVEEENQAFKPEGFLDGEFVIMGNEE